MEGIHRAVNHAGPKALGNMTRLLELTANTLVRLRERTPRPTNGAQAPGHNRKPVWVCGHEPGKCDENYNRNSGSGASQGGSATSGSSSGNTNDPDDSIQALRAVLEKRQLW
jgi:hypothetical protein